MAPMRSLVAASLLFLSGANAHFELVQPPSLEGDSMNEALQPNAPRGGGNPDLSSNPTVDFHVDGDAVALSLGHPQANFLIRATTDERGEGNWTQLFPIYTQNGRGDLCQPLVSAPKEWVGKKGIIGIACNAPDGMLFQCAAVNFVEGTNSSPGSSCTNSSSVTVDFNEDPALTALLSDSSDSEDPSPTSDSPAATSSNAAASLMAPGSGLPIGSLAIGAVMMLAGAALL